MRIICFIAICIFLNTSSAQSAQNPKTPLTLPQAQKMALAQHPALVSSEHRIDASKEEVTQAFSNYLPQVGGHGVRAYAGTNDRAAAIGGITNPLVLKRTSIGVAVGQMLFDFGRTPNMVEAARSGVDAQVAKSLSVRDQVIFEVTRTYYSTLQAQQIIKVAQETLAARMILLEKIQFLAQEKLKATFDVNIAEQSVDEAKLLVLKAKNDLDDAEASLCQALGYGALMHFDLIHEVTLEPLSAKLDSLLQLAKDQNHELAFLRAELAVKKSHYEAAISDHYPTINAIGYAGKNPSRHESELRESYAMAGITLDVPLYTGGRLTAAEQQRLSEMKAVAMDFVDKENQLMRDVRVAWNNVQSSYENIAVLKELFSNNVKALELAQAGYEFGRISIVDLAQEQLRKTQAEILYTNSAYEYLINRALLNLLLGNEEEICKTT